MSNEINLSKFLARYCNLAGKDLSKIKHEDVKVLFPSLKRASFEEIEKNRYLLASGEVLLVNDGKRVIPYFVPPTCMDEETVPMDFTMEEAPKQEINYRKYDYTKLSIYELRCLLRRKFNSYANQRNAKMELERRGIVLSKKYNRCEEKRKVDKIKDERY
jgi:hypothetical protein